MSEVDDAEVTARQQCLDELDEFTAECESKVSTLLQKLQWTPEQFMKLKEHKVCPYNAGHRMTSLSLERHAPRCELVNTGLSKEEAEEMLEEDSFKYKNAPCVYSMKLGLEEVNSVLYNHHLHNHSVFYGYKKLPRLPVEEECTMTRQDRLIIAEHIISRAKQANKMKLLGKDELLIAENMKESIQTGEERKLHPIEEMAALRDYRRRRQTYRAKNVHITKKSYTEVMQEVINNQMEMYRQSLLKDGPDQHSQDSESMIMNRRDDETKSEYSRSTDHSRVYDDRGVASQSSKPSNELEEHFRETKSYCKASQRSRSNSKSRHRSNSKSRHRSRSNSKSRHRSNSKSRHRSRSNSKSRHRSNSKSHQRSRSNSRSGRRSRSHSTSRLRSRSKSRHRSRSRSKEKKHAKSKHKRSRHRSGSTERKHKKRKHKDRKKDKNRDRSEDNYDKQSNQSEDNYQQTIDKSEFKNEKPTDQSEDNYNKTSESK